MVSSRTSFGVKIATTVGVVSLLASIVGASTYTGRMAENLTNTNDAVVQLKTELRENNTLDVQQSLILERTVTQLSNIAEVTKRLQEKVQ
jgi:hypothetical protein